MRASFASICLLLAMSMSGCSILAAQPDDSRFFTLVAMPGEPPTADAGGGGASYGIGPITLPAYLDRNEVAIRVSPSEIAFSLTDRWAESLSAGVSRVLLQNLSRMLGTDRIAVYPWVGEFRVDYQVRLEVLQLDCDRQGLGRLDARWGIFDGGSGRPLVLRTSRYEQPAKSESGPDRTAALSATLTRLSEDIAAALRDLPTPAEKGRSARQG